MNNESFNLEKRKLKREIEKHNAKRVLLQLPEGLKPYATELANIIQEAGALPIILGDPCYGACDLALEEAQSLNADLIVHYGHSPWFKSTRIPTVYFAACSKKSVKKAVMKALTFLQEYSHIGLVTTLQHVNKLEEARELLLKNGKIVIIGDAGVQPHRGQVIGCEYSNARSIADHVEAFLILSGGKFHAIGVAIATGKPVIVADPYTKNAFSVENEVKRVLKQRWACIHEAKKAKSFGVIVGLKIGQKKIEKAQKIVEELQNAGKEAYLLALREIVPERLMQFPDVEAFVNTACPRVSLDTSSKFNKPVLIPRELEVMLEKTSWEKLCKSGWFENDA